MTSVVIVNASTVLADAEVQAAIPAFTHWANTLVCPAYGLEPVTLEFAASGSTPPAAAWMLAILDASDLPGAIGYHLDSAGRVSGKVFAQDCLDDGVSWTVDLTHELGEMLVDPTAATIITLLGGRRTPKEICDPVEADEFGVTIAGVLCSNFVLPSYWVQGSGPWDYQARLTGSAPVLAPGGYAEILDPSAGSAWTTVFAERSDGTLGDRAARRACVPGRHAWKRRQ